MNGTFEWKASTQAGSKFATADPLVVTHTAGRTVAIAHPRAAKAMPRSS
jgi:hypothetical protein